jgi:hypothetical protein
MNPLAATVEINAYEKRPRTKGRTLPPENTLLTVRLFPRQEFVFITGNDAVTNFELFAQAHRKRLVMQGRIDDGTLVTLIDAKPRRVLVTVRGAQKDVWVTVNRRKLAPVGKGKRPETAADGSYLDLGITALYEHLNAVGTRTPASVSEVGIFSHSWRGGPIIWNTYDNQPAKDPQRSPADLDGRDKDWNSANLSVYPKLKAALRPGASLKVWGCVSISPLLGEISEANRQRNKTPPGRFYTVNWAGGTMSGESNTSLETTRFSVLKVLRETGYVATAARGLKIPCFGAPPGVGAHFGGDAAGVAMHIDLSLQLHQDVIKYLKDEFSLNARDAQNYIDYNHPAIQNATMAPLPFYTERWTHYRKQGGADLILPTKMTLKRPPGGAPFKVEAHSGLVGASLKGHLYIFPGCRFERVESYLDNAGGELYRNIFLGLNAKETAAAYMQSDGQVLMMTRSGQDWKVDTIPLPVHGMNTDPVTGKHTKAADLKPVTDGVLQSAPAQLAY